MDKIAKELMNVAKELVASDEVTKEELDDLRMAFPFHDVLEVLDSTYDSYGAFSDEEETPRHVLKRFKRAYPVWEKYDKLVGHYWKKDRRFNDAFRKTRKALQLLKILASGRHSDWQSGFVTLLARMKRAHESLYNIR